METLIIQNFKYGLDARRESLVEQPGTLAVCQNAHVNAGGELEKRYEFLVDANLFPTNTFGLEATDAGLVTFGTAASPNAALPTGVTYQKLESVNGAAIDYIIASCNYNGKAVVLTNSNGELGLYYDGTLVAQSINGTTFYPTGLIGITLAGLATQLAAQFNLISGWTATANADVNGNAYDGLVVVLTPPGVHINPTIDVISTSGLLAASLYDQNNGGTPGVAAYASFTLTGGTTGNVTVTAPRTKLGTGTFTLASAVPWHTNVTVTAADIVAAINNNTVSNGYRAASNAGVVTVYAPVAFGNFTFNLTYVTTGDITTSGTGPQVGNFIVSVNTTHLSVIRHFQFQETGLIVAGVINASTTGATGAITFQWTEVNANGAPAAGSSGITMSNATSSSCGFSAALNSNQSKQGYFKIVSTDAGSGTSKSLLCSVYLAVLTP